MSRKLAFPLRLFLGLMTAAGVGCHTTRSDQSTARAQDVAVPPPSIGIPFGPPQYQKGICPICGGLTYVHGSSCQIAQQCYLVVRCEKCGTISLAKIDLTHQAFVGRDGQLRVVDSDGTMRVGPAASKCLRDKGEIGLSVTRDSSGRILIAEVLPQTIAAEHGLSKGDELLRVNGKKMTGLPLDAVLDALHQRGAPLDLELERANQIVPVRLTW